uniref:Uncharacterized protein n=1 Tax=Oryza brachyantha TaxID=4533 RepID=J3LAQ5_ORYBR
MMREPSTSFETTRGNKVSCTSADQMDSRQTSGTGSSHERAASTMKNLLEFSGIASKLNSKEPKMVNVVSTSFSFTYETGPGAQVAYVERFDIALSHFSTLVSFLRALHMTATVRGWWPQRSSKSYATGCKV